MMQQMSDIFNICINVYAIGCIYVRIQEKELYSSHILAILSLAIRIRNMLLIQKIDYKIIENWQSVIRYSIK